MAGDEGPGERAGFQALERKVVGSTNRQAGGRMWGTWSPRGFTVPDPGPEVRVTEGALLTPEETPKAYHLFNKNKWDVKTGQPSPREIS